MAENEQSHSSARSLPMHPLDGGGESGLVRSVDFARALSRQPDDHLWDLAGDPFDSLLVPFVNEGRNPSDLTELGSGWCLTPAEALLWDIGDFQAVVTTPGLDFMDRNAIEGRPNSSHEKETSDLTNAHRFGCGHCSKLFDSQKDVDRHRSSVHDKYAPYFCHELGCRRSERGFTRKDNYETHLRQVHKKSSKDATQLETRDGNSVSQVRRKREAGEEGNLEGHSLEKLAKMVEKEREKCRSEQRRRQEVEEELNNLRRRYEERENMWLKLLMNKEGCN